MTMQIDPKDLAAALELVLGQRQDQAEPAAMDGDSFPIKMVADNLGITRAAVRDRILRGSLAGYKNERGEWRVPYEAAQEAYSRAAALQEADRRQPRRAKASPSGLMTVKDASAYLGVSTGLIYAMTRDNSIPSVRIGNSVRVRKTDLDEMFVNA
jgi:excisionase family DNA binding protein